MSALAGAGAVHSMPSYELCKRGVLVQERFGVAFTQLMKPCAISALKALALDDAKHRETHPARSRLAPSSTSLSSRSRNMNAAPTGSALRVFGT